jgi:hypothetical protein
MIYGMVAPFVERYMPRAPNPLMGRRSTPSWCRFATPAPAAAGAIPGSSWASCCDPSVGRVPRRCAACCRCTVPVHFRDITDALRSILKKWNARHRLLPHAASSLSCTSRGHCRRYTQGRLLQDAEPSMHQEQTARRIAAKDSGDDYFDSEKILVSGAA